MYISTITTCAPSQVLQSNDEVQSSRVIATQKDLVQGLWCIVAYQYIYACVYVHRNVCTSMQWFAHAQFCSSRLCVVQLIIILVLLQTVDWT